jgi:hypothetical protein
MRIFTILVNHNLNKLVVAEQNDKVLAIGWTLLEKKFSRNCSTCAHLRVKLFSELDMESQILDV